MPKYFTRSTNPGLIARRIFRTKPGIRNYTKRIDIYTDFALTASWVFIGPGLLFFIWVHLFLTADYKQR